MLPSALTVPARQIVTKKFVWLSVAQLCATSLNYTQIEAFFQRQIDEGKQIRLKEIRLNAMWWP